jgi:ribosomal protein S5
MYCLNLKDHPHNVVKATFDALLQMNSHCCKTKRVSLEKVFKG